MDSVLDPMPTVREVNRSLALEERCTVAYRNLGEVRCPRNGFLDCRAHRLREFSTRPAPHAGDQGVSADWSHRGGACLNLGADWERRAAVADLRIHRRPAPATTRRLFGTKRQGGQMAEVIKSVPAVPEPPPQRKVRMTIRALRSKCIPSVHA